MTAPPDPRKPQQPHKGKQGTLSTAFALAIGVELIAALAGAAILGYLADQQFGTSPWLALVGSTLGVVGGIYNAVRQVQQFSK
jgi:F0F1-type ATP synthase assembly protein I